MNPDQLSVAAHEIIELINCRNFRMLEQRFSKPGTESPAEAVQSVSELAADYGKIQRLGSPANDGEAALFVAQCERGFLDFKITFDQQQLKSLSLTAPATNISSVARLVADLVNESNYAALQKMFSRRMDRFLPADKCCDFFRQLTGSLGKIVSIEAPRPDGEWQVFRTYFDRGVRDFALTLDENGQIAGLYFGSQMQRREPLDKHQTRLALPLKGRWLVFWGGDSGDVNEHYEIANQRFAFDFVGTDEQGKLFQGHGDRNEDYFAFGREILAPADATVIEVIEGVHDNVPGSMNPFSAVGNCVMLQHRANEISVLAHLKQGSVKVKPGDKVKQLQMIALCGNSGNTSAPHLHYHLQDSPVFQDGFAVHCVFNTVPLLKGEAIETKTNYSPVRGDIIVVK